MLPTMLIVIIAADKSVELIMTSSLESNMIIFCELFGIRAKPHHGRMALLVINLSFHWVDSLRDIWFFKVLNFFRRQLDLDTRNSLIDAILSVQPDDRVLAGVTQ